MVTLCQAIALGTADIQILKIVKCAYFHEVYPPVAEPDNKQIHKYIYSIMTRSGKWYEEIWRKSRTETTEDDGGKGAYISKPIFFCVLNKPGSFLS